MPTDIYPNQTKIRIVTNYTGKGQFPDPLGSITFKHYHNMNDIQELVQCLSDIYSHDPVKMKIEMEVTND